jgi:hypothetical protein
MNRNQANGKWEQVQGRAKQVWGKLTDDDFTKAEGSVEKLYGITPVARLLPARRCAVVHQNNASLNHFERGGLAPAASAT